MGIRESINSKPWLGWVMAGVCLAGGVVMYIRLSGGSSSEFSSDRSTDMLTIKFTDTGDEIQMPRGRVIQQLMDRNKALDPSKGIQNPKTGAFTGFPYDKAAWDGMVKTIQEALKDHPQPAGGSK